MSARRAHRLTRVWTNRWTDGSSPIWRLTLVCTGRLYRSTTWHATAQQVCAHTLRRPSAPDAPVPAGARVHFVGNSSSRRKRAIPFAADETREHYRRRSARTLRFNAEDPWASAWRNGPSGPRSRRRRAVGPRAAEGLREPWRRRLQVPS